MRFTSLSHEQYPLAFVRNVLQHINFAYLCNCQQENIVQHKQKEVHVLQSTLMNPVAQPGTKLIHFTRLTDSSVVNLPSYS